MTFSLNEIQELKFGRKETFTIIPDSYIKLISGRKIENDKSDIISIHRN